MRLPSTLPAILLFAALPTCSSFSTTYSVQQLRSQALRVPTAKTPVSRSLKLQSLVLKSSIYEFLDLTAGGLDAFSPSNIFIESSLSMTGQANDWKFPLLLSCLAGASTSIGAAVVFVFSPSKIQQSMSFSLSLAASVMITVSVISIGPECLEGVFLKGAGESWSIQMGLLSERLFSFGLGCGGYYLLSRLLVTLPEPDSFLASSAKPNNENHSPDDEEHQTQTTNSESITPSLKKSNQSPSKYYGAGAVRRNIHREATPDSGNGGTSFLSHIHNGTLSLQNSVFDNEDNNGYPSDDEHLKRKLSLSHSSDNNVLLSTKPTAEERQRSWRVAMLLFVSLLLHNFPEGLAVVASTVESQQLGVTVAIGILIHNIPEGIAIAVPCMAARPDAPFLAFGLASLSGLAEPLGAILALTLLRSTQDRLPLENILACVAGIMCMVALIELYPEAYRHVHQSKYQGMVFGSLLGMAIMVATEWYLPA